MSNLCFKAQGCSSMIVRTRIPGLLTRSSGYGLMFVGERSTRHTLRHSKRKGPSQDLHHRRNRNPQEIQLTLSLNPHHPNLCSEIHPFAHSESATVHLPQFLHRPLPSFFPPPLTPPYPHSHPQPNNRFTHPHTLLLNAGHSLCFRIAASTACHSTRSSSAFLPGDILVIEVGREVRAGLLGG